MTFWLIMHMIWVWQLIRPFGLVGPSLLSGSVGVDSEQIKSGGIYRHLCCLRQTYQETNSFTWILLQFTKFTLLQIPLQAIRLYKPLHPGFHPNSFFLLFGLFSASCPTYKQYKLLGVVHVCSSTKICSTWCCRGICKVIYWQNSSCYWLNLLSSTFRFMLLPVCQRLKNLCKLVETMWDLSSLSEFQLAFRFLPSLICRLSWLIWFQCGHNWDKVCLLITGVNVKAYGSNVRYRSNVSMRYKKAWLLSWTSSSQMEWSIIDVNTKDVFRSLFTCKVKITNKFATVFHNWNQCFLLGFNKIVWLCTSTTLKMGLQYMRKKFWTKQLFVFLYKGVLGISAMSWTKISSPTWT